MTKLINSQKEKKYKDILRSSSIIAGASISSAVIGLVRTKAAALLLGPVGIGLIGLLQSLMSSATTIFALGFGTVGARQIADAFGNNNTEQLAVARRALVWGMLGLGLLGGMMIWLLRTPIAEYLLKDSSSASSVGWMAIGVFLTIASGSQGALLRGMRRIGDVARITVISSTISMIVGVLSLWIFGSKGILLYILAVPLVSYATGHFFVSRLENIKPTNLTTKTLINEWRGLAVVGTSFMLTGLVVAGSHFTVRSIIKEELGLESLGLYQAAWMVTVTYIGFVIGSMSNDYYPRLASIIRKNSEANITINQQIEITLLLATPILLFMQALAPIVIRILYSQEFSPAVEILRWQILGDAFKIAGWPLGLVALAANDSKTYMYTESVAIVIFVSIIWLLIPTIGINATGLAYLCMYIIYYPITLYQAKRITNFKYSSSVKNLILTAIGLSVGVFLLTKWSTTFGGLISCLVALTMSIYSIGRLWRNSNFGGPMGRIGNKSNNIIKKIGF